MPDSRDEAEYNRHDSAVKWLTRVSWVLVAITATQVERAVRHSSLEATVASIAAAAVLISSIVVAHVAGRSIAYQRLRDVQEQRRKKHRSLNSLNSICTAMDLLASTAGRYMEEKSDMPRELFRSIAERLLKLLGDLEKPENTEALESHEFKVIGDIAFEINALYSATSGWGDISMQQHSRARLNVTGVPDFIVERQTALKSNLQKLQYIIYQHNQLITGHKE